MGPVLGGDTDDKEDLTKDGAGGGIPGLPEWLNLEIVVPATATIIVICVGVLVICVAVTRRKAPQMTPGRYNIEMGTATHLYLPFVKGLLGTHMDLLRKWTCIDTFFLNLAI